MAIDLTTIAGYRDDMTAEEKLGLLASYEPPQVDTSKYIAKSTFDKTASELAEAKRQLKAKMTEDEQKEAERAAKEAEREALLESLKKDKAISESKSRYLALGYDKALAEETARAFSEGDMEKVFANQAIHLENVRKAAAASALAGDPTPPPGGNKTPSELEKWEELLNSATKLDEKVAIRRKIEELKAKKQT